MEGILSICEVRSLGGEPEENNITMIQGSQNYYQSYKRHQYKVHLYISQRADITTYVSSAKFVKHPVLGSMETLQMLLRSTCLRRKKKIKIQLVNMQYNYYTERVC